VGHLKIQIICAGLNPRPSRSVRLPGVIRLLHYRPKTRGRCASDAGPDPTGIILTGELYCVDVSQLVSSGWLSVCRQAQGSLNQWWICHRRKPFGVGMPTAGAAAAIEAARRGRRGCGNVQLRSRRRNCRLRQRRRRSSRKTRSRIRKRLLLHRQHGAQHRRRVRGAHRAAGRTG
jgi:hypothetical protein